MFCFTFILHDNPARYRWDIPTTYLAPLENFVAGDWIQCPETRCDWSTWCRKRMPKNKIHWVLPLEDDSTRRVRTGTDSDASTVGDECECITTYGLQKCVVETIPVRRIDKAELFWSVRNRLGPRVEALYFDELTTNHKRWCLYWYYAVNIFQIRSHASPLPSCVVSSVRRMYPNENNVPYVGFRSTEERAADSVARERNT